MGDSVVANCEDRMKKSFESTKNEINAQRTGRANPAVLDGIRVDSYGTLSPLNQVANITVPEPRLIVVHPYDVSMCAAIEKAIQESNIGLTPINNGNLVRLPIPELNEDRRNDIVKQCKKLCEDGKVAIRNIRRDSNDSIKKLEKDKAIGEDDGKRFLDQIQKHTDANIKILDEVLSKKEKEILEV